MSRSDTHTTSCAVEEFFCSCCLKDVLTLAFSIVISMLEYVSCLWKVWDTMHFKKVTELQNFQPCTITSLCWIKMSARRRVVPNKVKLRTMRMMQFKKVWQRWYCHRRGQGSGSCSRFRDFGVVLNLNIFVRFVLCVVSYVLCFSSSSYALCVMCQLFLEGRYVSCVMCYVPSSTHRTSCYMIIYYDLCRISKNHMTHNA